jgi:hypothetical protein
MDLLLRRVILGAGAIAAVMAFAASQVAGAGQQTNLGVEGALNSNVSVAAAGARVVLTWAVRSGAATDVYAAFSQDGGVTFGPPLRVNDLSGDARVSGEQAPRVGVGERVAVAWESRQAGLSLVRTASAASGAKAFTPAVNVHPDALAGARGWASLAVSPRGTVHVAWLDGRGDGASAASAAPAAAATSAARTPSAGARHAMRQDLFQAVLAPDGTRHEVRVATDVCFCCKTAVAAGSDGAVYVAWRHIYPPNLRDIAVARSDDGGRTFGQPSRMSEDGWAIDGCPDDGPSLAVDARGVVHVAWPTWVAESDRKGIFYSYSADGGRSFAPRLRVDDGEGSAAHPQLAAAGGRVLVLWDQLHAGGGRRVRMREIDGDPLAKSWTPRPRAPETLSDESAAATYPAVAATNDAFVAAWTEEAKAGSRIRVERLGL